MGNQYGRVLFLKDYASYIKDSMILELTDLNRRMMLSIDMIPVPTDEAVREVENKLLGVERHQLAAAAEQQPELFCGCPLRSGAAAQGNPGNAG